MTITNSIKFHTAHNIARILNRRGMDYRLAFTWAMREMWRAVEAFNVDGIEYLEEAPEIAMYLEEVIMGDSARMREYELSFAC